MAKLKRLLRPVLMVLGAVTIVAVLGFVEHHADRTPVKELQVTLDPGARGDQGVHFINEDVVRQQVLGHTDGVIGTAVGEVDVVGIERDLRGIGCVASANVYRTMDGTLHVRVKQREPIVRVINADGSGFYIDSEGWTMPLSDAWTARVLVVTGALAEPFSAGGVTDLNALGDTLAAATCSRALYQVARTLHADPLWDVLFEQAVVGEDGGIELIPRVGVQRVRIGDGSHLAQRLAKLKTFYAQGIAQTDWRRYSTIDLRFDDQVVCTKRTTP